LHNRIVATLAIWLVGFSCPAQQKAEISPERVNAALAQLDPFIRSTLSKTGVPGAAIAVVYNDQVVFLRGYGVRKVGEPAQVDPDTVFEIASFSKPIASTVLASLVGEGVIGWDDRIADLDPGFRLSSADITREVTIRDLLSHRSGLATLSGDMLENLGYTRPEILYRMRYLRIPGEFRKTYAYSNYGFTAGTIAAATKIGKPWETIAEQQLYSRVGMTSTSSRFSDYENRTDKAALHIFVNGSLSIASYAMPMLNRQREVSAPAPVISRNGSACNSTEASGTASRLWTRTHLQRPTNPRSVATPPTRPSQTIVPATSFMAWDGMWEPTGRVKYSSVIAAHFF
jgi:CubicO group peptidase (beta-lactamase class C family)